MAYQGIGTGITPNDNNGDSLLTGAVKINSNFKEIYNALGDGSTINFNQTTKITAGNGLTGGGDLSANRTIDVGAGDGISVAADSIAVNNTVVRTSGNQTISGIKTFNSKITGSIDSATDATNCSRSVIAGNGLTGGGVLSANRTLNVGAGTGIDVAEDSISINSSYRFPSGTRMLFQQTSAPTGWTKDTTNTNQRALRVVSGTAGSGGSVNFTSAFSSSRSVPLLEHTHVISGGSATIAPGNGGSATGTFLTGVALEQFTNKVANSPDEVEVLNTKTKLTTPTTGSVSYTSPTISYTEPGAAKAGTAAASMNFAVYYIDVIIAQRN